MPPRKIGLGPSQSVRKGSGCLSRPLKSCKRLLDHPGLKNPRVLPWKAEEACPRCLGVGHTLVPIFGGPHLRKTGCPKCKGQGVIGRNSTVHLDLTPDMIRQGRVRLRGMGRYQPQEGRRGDLVVEFRLELNGKPYSPGLWSA